MAVAAIFEFQGKTVKTAKSVVSFATHICVKVPLTRPKMDFLSAVCYTYTLSFDPF